MTTWVILTGLVLAQPPIEPVRLPRPPRPPVVGVPAQPPTVLPPSQAALAGRKLEEWIADLADKDPLVREEALEVLAAVGPSAKEAMPKIEKLLDESAPSVRLRAAMALYRIANKKEPAIKALCESLHNSSGPQAMHQTLVQLMQFGPDAASATPSLIDLADHPDITVRNQANQLLINIGRPALPALVERLADKDVRQRRRAAVLLPAVAAFSQGIKDQLKARLTDEDRMVRVNCARALWVFDFQDKDVRDVLVEAIRSGDATMRGEVLTTVSAIIDSVRGPAVRPIIEAALKVDDPLTRVRAAGSAYFLDGKPDRVMPILLDGLDNNNRTIWSQAALGISKLGKHAEPALPHLLKRLERPENVGYSYELNEAFAAIGAPAVAPLIESLQKIKFDPAVGWRSNEWQKIHTVTQALVRLGPVAAEKAAPLLDHEVPQVRSSGCQIIGAAGPAGAKFATKVAARLKDTDASVRQLALLALNTLGPAARDATDAIVEMATSDQPYQRQMALQALERIRPDPEKARPVALKALNDAAPYVRVAAVSLLVTVDPKHPDVIAQVRKLLADRMTRAQAMMVVGRLGAAAEPLVPAAIEAFRAEKDTFQKRSFLTMFTQVGPKAKEVLPDLLGMLDQRDTYTRQLVANALKAIGPGDPAKAVPAINNALITEPNGYARGLLIDVLATYGPAAVDAVPHLLDDLKKTLWTNQTQVAAALAQIAPERARKEAVPLLEKWLSNQQAFCIPSAVAICRLDPEHKDARTALLQALKNTDTGAWFFRQTAIDYFGSLGPKSKDLLEDLRKALEAKEPQVRISAAAAVWRVSGEAEAPLKVLTTSLKPPEQTYLRQQAAVRLGEIGPPAKAAVPTLVEQYNATVATDMYLRPAFATAVRKIDPGAADKAGMP